MERGYFAKKETCVSQLILGGWFAGLSGVPLGHTPNLCNWQEGGVSLARSQDSGRDEWEEGVVGKGEEMKQKRPRDSYGSCRALWLLLCVLKGTHFPGDSKQLFWHHFLDSVAEGRN